jgi:hypothetical protein
MAELQMYQPTGYLPAEVPRMDYANLKESVIQKQVIGSQLDRLADFAFKNAAETAQREGARYGAENQPTAEQVMTAMKEGKSPAELFAKPGTYFGDAARKIQAGQLRTELEVKGRQEFARLSALVESGSVDIKEVETTIQSLIVGYTKGVNSVDPEEGLQLRKSLSTAGNAVYTEATKKFAENYLQGRKVLAQEAIAPAQAMIRDTIKSESDPTMLAQRIKLESRKVQDVLSLIPDGAFYEKQMNEFKKAVTSEVVEYIMSPAMSKNPTDGYLKIQSGNIGKLTEVFNTGLVNKDDMLAAYMKKVSEKRQVMEASKSMANMAVEGTVNNLLIEYYTPETTQLRKNEIGKIIARSGVMSADKIERFLNPDVNDGDPALQANIMYRVKTGQIQNLDDLRKETNTVGLSGRQYAPLAQALITRTEKDEGQAYKIISNNAGLGDVRPGKNKDNAQKFDKEAKLLQFYNEAKEASILDVGSFNPGATADVAIQRYNKSEKANAQKNTAKSDLEKIAKDVASTKNLKQFSIDADTNVQDLLNKKLIDKDTAVYIQKRIDTLRQVEQ